MLGQVLNLAYPFKRRSSLVISIVILKAAKKGIRITHLLSLGSLSYEQLMRYMDFLMAHDFIKDYGSFYQTTDKGLKLIEEFDSSSLIREALTA
jgi:predicted transcriptional regulator